MLNAASIPIASERSTTRQPLTDDDVRRLLATAETVIIARGRSRRELAASETRPEELKGPTGSYRAPMLVVDRTLLVGFNAEALANLLDA